MIENDFLKGANKCPKHGRPLGSFKKFVSGTEHIWSGWCDICLEDKVTVHGNYPEKSSEIKDPAGSI